jgi:Zn-dependent peptidase ImmA (M78 family)
MRWARISAGFEDRAAAAEKLSVGEQTLHAWETGAAIPTLPDVVKAAKAFRRPLAAFLLPTPPVEAEPPPDYRLVWGADVKALGPEVRRQVATARELQDIAHDLMTELDERIALPDLGPRPQDRMDAAAAAAREWLEVPPEYQASWDGRQAAIEGWRGAIEDRGILVLFVPMPPRQIRGFSLSRREPPVIAVNSSDSDNAQIFSLLHEYIHVSLGTEGLCDPQRGLAAALTAPPGEIEQLCNELAGRVLVPKAELLAHPATHKIAATADGLTDGQLNRLTGYFKVSKPVMLIRLLRVGAIAEDRFEARWRELPWFLDPRQQGSGGGGGASRSEIAVKRYGAGYVRLVLEAVGEGIVHPVEAARYLDVQFDDLGAVDRILRKQA